MATIRGIFTRSGKIIRQQRLQSQFFNCVAFPQTKIRPRGGRPNHKYPVIVSCHMVNKIMQKRSLILPQVIADYYQGGEEEPKFTTLPDKGQRKHSETSSLRGIQTGLVRLRWNSSVNSFKLDIAWKTSFQREVTKRMHPVSKTCAFIIGLLKIIMNSLSSSEDQRWISNNLTRKYNLVS